MTTRFFRLALVLLALCLNTPLAAMPPPDHLVALRRGVNLTNWFRFPVGTDPASLRAYLSDDAIAGLRAAGFTFVRLAAQPDWHPPPALVAQQAARLQRAGLAVVIGLHPTGWRLESSAADRAALLANWRALAPELQRLDPALTFPEVLNEPVFPSDPTGWQKLQEAARAIIRAALPQDTIVLTGNDWGGIDGLLAARPSADPNVIYSIHFYDPVELTSLAAWRPGLDRVALARLPFPVADAAACAAATGETDPATSLAARFYCAQHWDSAAVAARLDRAAAWAGRYHAAVVMGEFGATVRLNRPARLAWLTAVRQACEERGLGWALWGYDDIMGFDVPRPPPRRPVLDPGVLAALGLPAKNPASHTKR